MCGIKKQEKGKQNQADSRQPAKKRPRVLRSGKSCPRPNNQIQFLTKLFDKNHTDKYLFLVFIIIAISILAIGLRHYFSSIYTGYSDDYFLSTVYAPYPNEVNLEASFNLSINDDETHRLQFELNSIYVYFPGFTRTTIMSKDYENKDTEELSQIREEEIAYGPDPVLSYLPEIPDQICFPDFEMIIFYNRTIDRYLLNLHPSISDLMKVDLEKPATIPLDEFCVPLYLLRLPIESVPYPHYDSIDLNYSIYWGDPQNNVFPNMDNAVYFPVTRGINIKVFPFDDFEVFFIPYTSFVFMKDNKAIKSYDKRVLTGDVSHFNLPNAKWDIKRIHVDETEYFNKVELPSQPQLYDSNSINSKFNLRRAGVYFKYTFERTYAKKRTLLSFSIIFLCICLAFTIREIGSFIQSIWGIFIALWGVRAFLVEILPTYLTLIDEIILLYISIILLLVIFKTIIHVLQYKFDKKNNIGNQDK